MTASSTECDGMRGGRALSPFFRLSQPRSLRQKVYRDSTGVRGRCPGWVARKG